MVVTEGFTVKGDPVPIEVPLPQDPVYHLQEAPVPKLPPFTVRITDEPAVTESEEADTEVGEVLGVLVASTRVAILSQPAALVSVVEYVPAAL